MSEIAGPAFLVAPGAERPDFTAFDFPDATLTDTSVEEIEFDQALSLAGRQGRDFLGAQVFGVLAVMGLEHLTITTADHQMELLLTIATRTGAFQSQDPELIWSKFYEQSETAPTTAQAETLDPHTETMKYGEPFMYVAPRLFFRQVNNLDVSLAVGDLDMRFGSIAITLSFRAFIELLERFADVTLL